MPGATPQFGKAEYLGQASPDRCRFCQQPIGTPYFRVNGAMACAACAEKAKFAVPGSDHAAFVRALFFGAGAALGGFVLYAAFTIMTGWMIGYISLAVGYMIGKAMIFGSRGLGGRRYQIAAVLLTYAAVSMAAIPIAMAQSGRVHLSAGGVIAKLALLGLASPFLDLADPIHGLIGLVILFIGLQIAWKLTAGRSKPLVDGPFDNPAPKPL